MQTCVYGYLDKPAILKPEISDYTLENLVGRCEM